jgi:outer membrane receptor protein involved in Fe transport
LVNSPVSFLTYYCSLKINSEDYLKTFRGEEMKKNATNLLALLVFLLLSTAVIAQTGVGKISGKVIDADTKEPLIGANIILLNTNLGAATDVEGNYFILNITPGTYEVKVSYVGYASKTIQEVRIVANITYELDVALTTDFTLPEIIVEDKKLFEPTATNTIKVIDSEQISRIPVRGIANISSLQSGVVIEEGSGGQSGNASINVRGGRGSEVLYIIDGVPQNNLYNRGTVAQVSNVAIDQISFQVGGYEAKYGQAQSGIVNVTTKSGQSTYNVLADVISSTYTDDFGYNLYSGTISGPIIPGIPEHTFFFSGERQWNMDDNPPAIPFEFPTIEKTYKHTPDNNSQAWRISGKTTHRMGEFALNLSGIYNTRDYKLFSLSGLSALSYRFIKNDSRFADGFSEENLSLNARISQTVSQNTFWNVNIGYRTFEFKRFNPIFKDDLLAYGDSLVWFNTLGIRLYGDGFKTALVDENNDPILNSAGDLIAANTDENGIYRPYGWANNLYQRRGNDAINVDFDITSQIGEHLLEFGAGASQTIVRGYGVYADEAGLYKDSTYLSTEQKFIRLEPFVYGYDATGQNKIGSDFDDGTELAKLQRPYEPILGYVYLQDRFELEDLVINVGVRADYFDFKSYELVNPALPYANGSSFMINDFKLRDAEIEVSPRIGVGFPVTESTVFHAQYGRFIQAPELNDVYFGPYDYNAWLPGTFDPQSGFNGSLKPEETTQYELGFRQLFADGHAALNITAFYKNVRDLINVQLHQWQQVEGGSIRTAIYPENSDFGTTRGLLFSLDITRLSYFSLSAQYTFQNAEGTGSSTSSSQTSVFRNLNGLPPKTIAPLSFDQKHTAIINLDFYVPEGELGFFEMFNINALFSFNSGRPYTPVSKWNLLGDNSLIADNLGYINSAYAPGSFRIDLKVEKTFMVGDYMLIAPYVWIENLLDTDNITGVYRSTGDPLSTGWLNTEDGRNAVELAGEGWRQDFISLERNPWNFGIPRLIKLGLKINFTNISL